MQVFPMVINLISLIISDIIAIIIKFNKTQFSGWMEINNIFPRLIFHDQKVTKKSIQFFLPTYSYGKVGKRSSRR